LLANAPQPNIVVKGAFESYQEDYWGKLMLNNKTEIVMAHNCVRCKSINVDYKTGKPGVGASGEILKRLQKDRRIDIGAKWSPVFGRYGFWGVGCGDEVVKVGDRVNVKKMNEGYTVWSKFVRGFGKECGVLMLCRLARNFVSAVRDGRWYAFGHVVGMVEERRALIQNTLIRSGEIGDEHVHIYNARHRKQSQGRQTSIQHVQGEAGNRLLSIQYNHTDSVFTLTFTKTLTLSFQTP
jgi:hypothetical protein